MKTREKKNRKESQQEVEKEDFLELALYTTLRKKMTLIILMCFLTLLNHSVFGGVSDDNQNGDTGGIPSSEEANSGSSQNFSIAMKGYLPPVEEEFTSTKHGKVRKVRAVGKQVNLPADIVRQMKDTPLSVLSGSLPENQKIIIDTHNQYRCEVSPPAENMLKLKWNEQAREKALTYAKRCIEDHSPITQRTLQDPEMTCGENLMASPYKLTWDFVVKYWNDEYTDFEYGKGPKKPNCVVGHFIQLAWASSRLLGCDVWECDNLVNRFLYVCHYCPAGNRGDKTLPYKKGTPCSACPNACDGGKLCTNACPVEDKYSDCGSYNTNNECTTDESLVSDCPATCKCTNGEIR
ncbi:serotriflin-like [Hyperolius riggenbachi]|uniref:serotriflin-like n=1 Tax=Hyperolius riggenbachi TaxID=752182 RepID=UPI0035A3CA80